MKTDCRSHPENPYIGPIYFEGPLPITERFTTYVDPKNPIRIRQLNQLQIHNLGDEADIFVMPIGGIALEEWKNFKSRTTYHEHIDLAMVTSGRSLDLLRNLLALSPDKPRLYHELMRRLPSIVVERNQLALHGNPHEFVHCGINHPNMPMLRIHNVEADSQISFNQKTLNTNGISNWGVYEQNGTIIINSRGLGLRLGDRLLVPSSCFTLNTTSFGDCMTQLNELINEGGYDDNDLRKIITGSVKWALE